MPESEFNDAYVAELLAKDARDVSLRYSAVGMDAYPPAKLPASKPRPNTRFLRAIIKETDNHNSALRAKETAESKARLHKLQTKEVRSGLDIRKRQLGLITAHINNPMRPRSDSARHAQVHKRPSEDRERPTGDRETGHTINHKDKRREEHEPRDIKRRRSVTHEERENRHARKCHSRRHRSGSSSDSAEDRPRKRRFTYGDDGSKSSSSRSVAHRDRTSHSQRRSRSYRSDEEDVCKDYGQNLVDSRQKREDSDPLDDIIGPRPLAVQKIQSRGRGQISAGSGIDNRFSSDYDPTSDVQLDVQEANDWDQALEALRDRQKWHKNSADRLKAAGFTQEEIERWERGGEKKEEDVRWAKQGEDREWDRGKTVEIEGVDVIVRRRTPEVDMSFGRLRDH